MKIFYDNKDSGKISGILVLIIAIILVIAIVITSLIIYDKSESKNKVLSEDTSSLKKEENNFGTNKENVEKNLEDEIEDKENDETKIEINNNVGNTVSNIRNYGYCATDGLYLYYTALSEDGENVSIYKSKINGQDREELLTQKFKIVSINVKDDYLYFIGMNGSVSNSNDINIDHKIFRMKNDGTKLEVINDNEFHYSDSEIYVVNDKIYYIGTDANIYTMNLDGSKKTKLNDDGTGFLGVTDKYIILNLPKSENNKYVTYIMNLDGSNKHKLTENRIYSINVKEEYVYFVDDNQNIYRVKVDGTEEKLISDNCEAYNLNVSDKYIYYMDYKDEKQNEICIYRMNLDGTNKKSIYQLNDYSTFLNVFDNKIIFSDNTSDSGMINLIDSNGKKFVRLFEFVYEN